MSSFSYRIAGQWCLALILSLTTTISTSLKWLALRMAISGRCWVSNLLIRVDSSGNMPVFSHCIDLNFAVMRIVLCRNQWPIARPCDNSQRWWSYCCKRQKRWHSERYCNPLAWHPPSSQQQYGWCHSRHPKRHPSGWNIRVWLLCRWTWHILVPCSSQDAIYGRSEGVTYSSWSIGKHVLWPNSNACWLVSWGESSR